MPPAFGRSHDLAPVIVDMVHGSFASNLERRDADIARVRAGYVAGSQASLLFLKVSLNQGDHPEASARSVVRETLRGLSERTHREDWFDDYKRYASVEYTYSQEHIASRILDLAESALLALHAMMSG